MIDLIVYEKRLRKTVKPVRVMRGSEYGCILVSLELWNALHKYGIKGRLKNLIPAEWVIEIKH